MGIAQDKIDQVPTSLYYKYAVNATIAAETAIQDDSKREEYYTAFIGAVSQQNFQEAVKLFRSYLRASLQEAMLVKIEIYLGERSADSSTQAVGTPAPAVGAQPQSTDAPQPSA